MTRILHQAVHYGIYLTAGVVIVLSALALLLRLWLMPDIDRHRLRLAQLIAEATGVPAAVGRLAAGWHGLSPYLLLEDVRLVPPGRLPDLTLPRVEATVSWSSILFGELRLSSIRIDRPHVVIHRDSQGTIRAAGIPVNTPGAGTTFPDWLLRQRLTVVRQATVVWQDDLLGAPPLTLSDLKLVLYNRLGRHRLGLTARPPDTVARFLDVRADFRGRSLARLEDFSGRLFVHAEGASSGALATWAPWAQPSVRSGVGALRFWLDFSQRRVDGLLGDVRLHRVAIGPTKDLPEIRFAQIEGRLGWRRSGQGHDYFVERLGFVSPQGHKAPPASVRVHVAQRPDGRAGDVRVEVEDLRLEALTALIGSVPIPRQAHDLIEAHAPRGYVDRLRLDWKEDGRYRLEARLREAGLRAAHGIPGITGLTGEVAATHAGGEARIDARGLKLEDATLLRHPLLFDTARARLDWERRPSDVLAIQVSDLRLANPDLEASGAGRILLRPHALPEVDIEARLTRGAGHAVWRYLPHAVSDDAYAWLRRGILAGVSDDTRLVLRGPLERFPFHEGGGQFRVDVKVRDARIEVAPGWPRFVGVNGWVVFRGQAMEILVDRAQVEGIPAIQLYGIKGLVPDLHHTHDEILHMEGRARGPTAAFLDYVRASPVHDYTDRFTGELRAEGRGELALRLNLPLRRIDDSTVAGVYRMADNRLDPGRDLPVLEGLTGDLHFTHREVTAKGLQARLLGKPVSLGVQTSSGGRVRLTLDGRITPAGLAPWVPAPLLARLKGETGYHAELVLHPKHTELNIESALEGLVIDLPEPLGKAAGQRQAFRLVHAPDGAGRGLLALHYGELASAKLLPAGAQGTAAVTIRIGPGEAGEPREPGLTLEAVRDRLELDPWLALAERPGEATLPIRSLRLAAKELILAGRLFTGTQIEAHPTADGWQLRVAGRELDGELHLHAQAPAPRILGRFRRLGVPEPAPGATPVEAARRDWQVTADLQAASFLLSGRDLGSLTLLARPEMLGLRIETLRLANADAKLEVTGLLSNHPRRFSSLDVRLESGNLRGLLDRLGYPGNVRRGEGSIQGRLGWRGGLPDFALERLSGDLEVQLKRGQFLKLDPGAGRLLGVLSLQALPRRVTLDFRDIFSEGFAFDEIAGPVHLEQGVAQLAEFQMRGPAASIRIQGEIDLVRETQDLRVAVQPRLEDTLAAGAMLVNPAVGIGALVASKVLQDPISKAATFEYAVRGSWSDPEVKRIPRPSNAQEGQETPP